jgi:hypothetical protein
VSAENPVITYIYITGKTKLHVLYFDSKYSFKEVTSFLPSAPSSFVKRDSKYDLYSLSSFIPETEAT